MNCIQLLETYFRTYTYVHTRMKYKSKSFTSNSNEPNILAGTIEIKLKIETLLNQITV